MNYYYIEKHGWFSQKPNVDISYVPAKNDTGGIVGISCCWKKVSVEELPRQAYICLGDKRESNNYYVLQLTTQNGYGCCDVKVVVNK